MPCFALVTLFPLERNVLGAIKTFPVFGETIEVLVNGEMTGGLSATLIQISPPGGGPPPHCHTNEDETFIALEGEYEFLIDGEWRKGGVGEVLYGQRGKVHTFRNVGNTLGRMLVFVTPAGLEKYLEAISSITGNMPQVLAISAAYGVSFPQ